MKRQELNFTELADRKYKVERRFPEIQLSETKVFRKRLDAIKQLADWLE